MAERMVLLAGATGLVGSEVLKRLVRDPGVAQVRALVRRPLPAALLGSKVTQAVVDFERLEDHPEHFVVDQVICALGTTIRQAGSQEAFRRVDHDYPVTIGRLALATGAGHFLLVSSVGADPAARAFYPRVKGEVEQAIVNLGYRATTIARPSLLLGERADFRPAERIVARLGFLMPARVKPVEAARVAAALVRAAREDQPGIHILDNTLLRATPPD
jgi:uncharacterized protein YbjT (DUF2867 family)